MSTLLTRMGENIMPPNVETMFSAVETPWHRLGVVTADALSAAEAIVIAGLDWDVELQELYRRNGAFTEVEYRAIVRQDTNAVLGFCSPQYGVIVNRKLFTFADQLLSAGVKYETAGSLDGGKRVWILARVPRDVVVAGDRTVSYLLIASSHDASLACTIKPTQVRVVCENTLDWALAGGQKSFKVKHTSGALSNMAKAKEALEVTYEYLDGFEAEVEALMNQAIPDPAFEIILDEILPSGGKSQAAETRRETSRSGIRSMWRGSENIGQFRGTGWGVVNAVSEWELWAKPVPESQERDAVMARRIVDGRATPLSAEAHKLLVGIR